MDIEDEPQKKDYTTKKNDMEPQTEFLSFAQSDSVPYSFTFRMCKSLYEEQQSVCNMMCSKKLNTREIARKKRESNCLFSGSNNYKGNIYQSFIPNKVITTI